MVYEDELVSFEELLEVFWFVHDPTQLNRQGNDIGTQYRSVILAETDDQAREAVAAIAALEADGTFDAPIVTEVTRLDRFWPAEEHHRQYFRRHPEQAYCRAMIAPKVAKLRSTWSHRLKGSS